MTDTPQGSLPTPVVPGLADLSVFARGGYATVYRAVQGFIGREVAVKVENRTLESERDKQRFLREARAAGRMSSHPHVVDLFDAGVTADGHPYLIMELCDGSYAERMRTSPLGAIEARELGVKIADALADAHELGILHRDVKPANILCSRFGEPTLADFGLAVIAEVRDPTVTLEALTPAYAPPEVFGHSPPSPAVDVYALCATLYAVMYGKPPRWGDEPDPGLMALMELFDEPIPDLPGIPSALVDVIRHGMANDPTARPSAAQLRDLLAAVPLGPPPALAVPEEAGAMPAIYLPRSPAAPPPGTFPVPGPEPAVPVTGSVPSGSVPPPAWPEAAAAPNPAPIHGRWPVWIAAGVGALLLLVAISVGGWFVATRSDSVPTPESTRGQQNFLLATRAMTAAGWRFLVLPPAPEAVERGDRTYRGLAGRGPDSLDGPTLGR